MNYVAIDPSLSCTAMVVNDQKFVYTTSSVALTKKGELKRWFQECEDVGVRIRVFDDIDSTGLSHNQLELTKLGHFSGIVGQIVEDIEVFGDLNDQFIIGIEGYSYSSSAGPLIDLVTFGTLLRRSIFNSLRFVQCIESGHDLPELKILQPTEVKQRAAALTYPPIKKGKKIEYRNKDGVAGGSFKKHEMYKVLTENSSLGSDIWVQFIQSHEAEVSAMKSVPKPIEDVNDAKILYEILKAPQPLQ